MAKEFASLRVKDQASNYPHTFTSWRSEHVGCVLDLPIGEMVLGLPSHTIDVGWKAVIVAAPGGEEAVRLGWVHPEIVEVVPTLPDMVTVGHTDWRGRNGPSHSIGWGPLGTRSHDTTLVLDARWQGRDGRPDALLRDVLGIVSRWRSAPLRIPIECFTSCSSPRRACQVWFAVSVESIAAWQRVAFWKCVSYAMCTTDIHPLRGVTSAAKIL